MDIYAVLGELIYIISNYEKGRIRARGFWSGNYVASLNESVYCMCAIIKLMQTPTNIQESELLYIKSFCKKKEGIIFPKGDITLLDNIANEVKTDSISAEYMDVILKMNSIVKECIVLLRERKRGYKERLSCLIKAFHNFPRVFIDNSKQTVYSINAKSIQVQDALLYASSYVDLDLL